MMSLSDVSMSLTSFSLALCCLPLPTMVNILKCSVAN